MALSGFHRLGELAVLVGLGLWFVWWLIPVLLFADPLETFDRGVSLLVGFGSAIRSSQARACRRGGPAPEIDGGTVGAAMTTLASIFSEPPVLTPSRVRFAYAVAATTDALQFLLGPIGWAGADEAVDVAATILIWRVLGFHPLLLPTFLIELLPVTDMLPTWTGCVALVIALRRRQLVGSQPPGGGPVIDV